MKFVSVVISSDNVKKEDVFCLRVQPGETKFHLRKHLPETRKGNW